MSGTVLGPDLRSRPVGIWLLACCVFAHVGFPHPSASRFQHKHCMHDSGLCTLVVVPLPVLSDSDCSADLDCLVPRSVREKSVIVAPSHCYSNSFSEGRSVRSKVASRIDHLLLLAESVRPQSDVQHQTH